MREARTDKLIEELVAGLLDAIVIATPLRRSDLRGEALFADQFLLAGSRARLDQFDGSGAIRPVALDPEQLLLLDEGHCLADQALEVCGLTRRQTRIDLGASSLSTLVGLAAEGFGLTFLPEIALGHEMRAAPGMALMRFVAPQPQRNIARVRRATTPGTAWFADLAQHLRRAGEGLLATARQHG